MNDDEPIVSGDNPPLPEGFPPHDKWQPCRRCGQMTSRLLCRDCENDQGE